jgi:hypothetical protein
MDTLSSVAATAGTAELWATAADTLRWKAGTLTELRLLVRHPQVLNGTSQLGEATAAIGQELATCGLTNPL